jgi:L-cysteine/cystine lyase
VNFDEARAQFPVLDEVAYLNAGSAGPLAQVTVEAMAARQDADLRDGRGGEPYIVDMLDLRRRVRAALAHVISVPPENVALTASTTEGCNIVLAGLRLGPADEVVTTDEEHFGLLGPLHTSGARVRVVPTRGLSGADALGRLLDAVGRETRLLALSHVSWVTGNVLPIAELKRETGLPILVDGAQSAGAIEVDATPFDFYTVSGQKWPCGPDSTGALYVREPESLPISAPTYVSQQRFEPDGTFEPSAGARRFDHGHLGAMPLTGLEAALDAAPGWRFERARATAARCRELLAERHEVVTAPGQATLVSFRPHGEPASVVERLHERGVVVRDIPGSGLVRVSVGYWTSDDDLDRLVSALP